MVSMLLYWYAPGRVTTALVLLVDNVSKVFSILTNVQFCFWSLGRGQLEETTNLNAKDRLWCHMTLGTELRGKKVK